MSELQPHKAFFFLLKEIRHHVKMERKEKFAQGKTDKKQIFFLAGVTTVIRALGSSPCRCRFFIDKGRASSSPSHYHLRALVDKTTVDAVKCEIYFVKTHYLVVYVLTPFW